MLSDGCYRHFSGRDLEWTHLSVSMDLTSDLCALKAPCLQKTFFFFKLVTLNDFFFVAVCQRQIED